MSNVKSATKKSKILISLLFIVFLIISTKNYFFSKKRELNFNEQKKIISINDNGFDYVLSTNTNTLKYFFDENKIVLGEHDEVMPELDSIIYPGMNIEIKRALKTSIIADGKTFDAWTVQRNVANALRENGIILGRLDKVEPDINYPLSKQITVTRINIEEKIIPEDIDFKTITKTDSKLGWREKQTQQPGEKGIREIKYRITYKNGKEVSRVALEKNITKDPILEIIVQGTYVKLGKGSTGQGTWYAFKGGLFAASPWLTIGSYAKVTNRDNGKSVIVQINDRGPTGPGRIVDLDKVAFQKVATLGAGVINVKVEEVLN